jgi:hypothetical protein
MRRIITRALLTITLFLLALTLCISFAIAGALQLSNALVHACSLWLGNAILADVVSGTILVVVPCSIALLFFLFRR